MTHLSHEVDRPLGRDRSEPLHEGLEVESNEQLHHIVEGAVVRDPEVVELDGVGRTHGCRRLRL